MTDQSRQSSTSRLSRTPEETRKRMDAYNSICSHAITHLGSEENLLRRLAAADDERLTLLSMRHITTTVANSLRDWRQRARLCFSIPVEHLDAFVQTWAHPEWKATMEAEGYEWLDDRYWGKKP